MIPLPTLIHDAVEPLKASLNVVVVSERALDGPEDLTNETAQMSLYTHRCQDDRGQLATRGAELLTTPTPVSAS